MIRISVEVGSGTASFRAAVWAESIERAVALVKTRYPASKLKVLYPIDPESFFVGEGSVSAAGAISLEMPEEAAG